jgi:signal peptidase I
MEPRRRRRHRKLRTRRKRPFWVEIPIMLGIALVLALGIKSFLVQPFSIPSGSMEPTLKDGDRVLVDKFTPWFGATPERGEVVVFRDPGGWLDGQPKAEKSGALMEGIKAGLTFVGLMPSTDEKDLVKRVIGVGGDTIRCRAGSPVSVNGKILDESYVYPGAKPCDDYPVGTVKVPKGHLWVMGDHRNDSWDSRYHRLHGKTKDGGGFVPEENVIGRAFVLAWPVSRWSGLPALP